MHLQAKERGHTWISDFRLQTPRHKFLLSVHCAAVLWQPQPEIKQPL
jgi:hypothetical protein